MATPAQKTAVILALVTSGLSLGVAVARFVHDGDIALTPLAGGLFMLALGISGLKQLRKRQKP